jgi:hypothetical protein
MMDHYEEKIGKGVTCRPWKIISVEEMFNPILHIEQQQD